ncbi:microsomal glutathione S-transferase 1-like [Maniola jurtina]|uniref:microsomal glutathione S-transferase 1-like n=1 Tax=Maniola jurtina TaxID=191418 RepID=UPI001E68D422|nr:microsomal glutathione S-transferase 1-like [Maniola jurtina]
MAAIELSNPTVQSYIIYSAILALKLLAVGTLTSLVRMGKGIFSNPEDAKAFKGKVKLDDPIVERTRRAHLNDLENIPAFWILGALYLTTAPAAAWATLLFRVYTVCRVIHTLVYAVIPLPQPARGIAYMVPYIIKWYMGVQVILYYLSAL